jgi:hypothetical protein
MITVWWEYIVVPVLLLLGIYGFLLLTGFEKRLLTRKTDRTAESMYDDYADSAREQKRFAKRTAVSDRRRSGCASRATRGSG